MRSKMLSMMKMKRIRKKGKFKKIVKKKEEIKPKIEVENVEDESENDFEDDDDEVDGFDGTNVSEEEEDVEENDDDDDDDDEEKVFNPGKRKLNEVQDNEGSLPKVKKLKKHENDLYKQPTVEELNQLRETENLFHSNLFRLQIEETLSEVKLKDKYKKQFTTWFNKLKESILSLKESKSYELSDVTGLMKIGVKVPELNLPKNDKVTFRYLEPTDMKVIGGYCLGTSLGPNVKIDVMIQIPSKLFIKHDYENYAYLTKRSMYLSYLASHLPKELVQEKYFIGESWLHNLKIIPTGSLSKRVTIHLHLSCEEGSFKLNRFLPSKNNVKPGWYLNSKTIESTTPTPNYNANVLRDLVMAGSNTKAEEIVTKYPSLRDGIILLKIWFNQRQPDETLDGFNGHILTMYVLYLLQQKKLNTYMSSYQIIRNVWTNLIQSDWSKEGITLCTGADSKQQVDEYHKYYDCVFLDYTGYHNLVANVSVTNYNWLKSQAQIAIESLDNLSDSFQNLFLRRLPFHATFDHFICINSDKALTNIFDKKILREKTLDLGVNKRLHLIKLIVDVLRKALTNRVSQIYVKPDELKQWKTTGSCCSSVGKIFIGLELDPNHCFNVIDKGPHPNSLEAVDFKKFWGSKSELRRFKDGSICEATVWISDGSSPTISQKRMVCKSIVNYILNHKLDLSDADFCYFGDQIDDILKLKTINISDFNYGTGEEASLRVVQAFNELEKELTEMRDIPLRITGVQGTSSVFRYTDAYPPLATTHFLASEIHKSIDSCVVYDNCNIKKVSKFIPTVEIVVQLSISGKWPNELEAFRKTKTAFYLQIAESLRKQYKLKVKANYNWVDILKNGFVFRLRIGHEKEVGLVKQIIGDDGVLKYRDNEESLELEKTLFHLAKLSGALNGLHSQEPSFGPTCCLVKRWLSAQLIDDFHLPQVAIELIIASIFLSPAPYKPAQTPQVSFIRALQFFSRQSWITEPIVVNFNNEISKERLVEITNNFQLTRETLPPVFIITPYDTEKSIWTKKAPTKIILHRVAGLSNEALKLIDLQLLKKSIINFQPIFQPPMGNYHILIHLHQQFNPKRYQYHQIDKKAPVLSWISYRKHSKEVIPIVNFNPVDCYLNELRKSYSEFALFFHDSYGGSVIGVLINPEAMEPKDFKVNNINCRRLTDSNKLILNISAMIEDFSIIGDGLVKEIVLQSESLLQS